jgi:hypothetical protein
MNLAGIERMLRREIVRLPRSWEDHQADVSTPESWILDRMHV